MLVKTFSKIAQIANRYVTNIDRVAIGFENETLEHARERCRSTVCVEKLYAVSIHVKHYRSTMSFCLELFQAIQSNDIHSEATIRRLFSTGEDIGEQDTGAGSPLIFATALGHNSLVELLLEMDVDFEEAHHANHMRAMHVAAAMGRVDCLQTLLNAGALRDSADNQGWTPLMFAVQSGFDDIVEVLLSAGASVDAKDKLQRTALMQAARCENLSIAEQLIVAGADVNAIGFRGTVFTPLIVAATAGANDVIRMLVESGAIVDFLDLKDGYTALMMAARMGHADTVKLLLEFGADVSIETEYMVSSLTMAKRGGHSHVEAILCSAGAVTVKEAPLPIMFPWGLVGDPMLVMEMNQRLEETNSNIASNQSSIDKGQN